MGKPSGSCETNSKPNNEKQMRSAIIIMITWKRA